MTNQWLPEGYEPPSAGGIYFKPQIGENRVRILGDFLNPHTAIMGYIGWTTNLDGERKPVRGNMNHFYEVKEKGDDDPKHFWNLTVWDYSANAVKVWEITQSTIQQAITDLSKKESWGDPRYYDISITRKGEKLDTTYNIIPENPKGDPAKEVIDAAKEASIDLRELFKGGVPFGVDKSQIEKNDKLDLLGKSPVIFDAVAENTESLGDMSKDAPEEKLDDLPY